MKRILIFAAILGLLVCLFTFPEVVVLILLAFLVYVVWRIAGILADNKSFREP